MWDNPNKVIEYLNKLYSDDDWNLKFVKLLNNGYSGAILFICQAEPTLHYVVIKSFDNKDTALLERKNNFKAWRQFDLRIEALTEVVEFNEGKGACFCMQLSGGESSKDFSRIITKALETGDSALAVQIIELISTKLRSTVPMPVIKDAFADIRFDNNLHKELQELDPDLYIQFRDWWKKKHDSKEHRTISFAPAHGDLHTDNILILKTDNVCETDIHLIDFGHFGEYPILKDFARLECDIRFRLFEVHLPNKEDALEFYLKEQEQITELSLNQEESSGTGYRDSLGEQGLGISPNLYSLLRTALLDCGPFATEHELKAIFVDERLSPWRNRLPQANNITLRVEITIEFLHNKYNDAGENALVLLLDVLSKRSDPEEACHSHLVGLAGEFRYNLMSRNDARYKSAEQKAQASPQELDAPSGRLKVAVELVRMVKKCARGSIGGDTRFEYDYICFLEFLFFAANSVEKKSKLQRIAAFREAIRLTKRIDEHYEQDDYDRKNGVLWRLAYTFLRLEQLPSGGWARSLPNWLRTFSGDTENSRSRAFEMRKLGGLNLTCMAILNYGRTLFTVLGQKPEEFLHLWESDNNQEIKELLSALWEIERHNQVCKRVIQYVVSRTNSEGAIPAAELVREVNTEVHHTLLGIIILLLAHFISGRKFDSDLDIIKPMCEYLARHGSNVNLGTARSHEIYCAVVFLRHLLSYKVFETHDAIVNQALLVLPKTLEKIRLQLTREDTNYRYIYPNIKKNTSSFLMNLPLMLSLSECDPLEKNPVFTSESLRDIELDKGLVACEMGAKTVSDWGHTAEYWWAKKHLEEGSDLTHRALGTLITQLSNQNALSLTHGVSFSYAIGLCEPPDPAALRELDEQINQVSQTIVTERNLLSLIAWIYHQEYRGFPILKQDLEADQSILEAIPRGHKLFPIANEFKNLLLSKLQPGDYLTEDEERKRWQDLSDKAIKDTKRFFENSLGELNNENCAQLLPYKKWLHLFNYLGHEPVIDKAWVLDVGCGSGAHAIKEFIPKGYRVHFLDFSKRVLKRIEDQLKEMGISAEEYSITEGSIESLSNPLVFKRQLHNGHFKVIFADAVLFHVAKGNVPSILRRFHEILADDGFLFANFKVNDHTLIGIDGRLFEFYANHWEIQKMFEDAGFFVEDVTLTKKNRSMYGSPYPTYWAHFICKKEHTN